MGEGRAAVVGQRAEQGINAEQIAGARCERAEKPVPEPDLDSRGDWI
jgi:hypothetical protein